MGDRRLRRAEDSACHQDASALCVGSPPRTASRTGPRPTLVGAGGPSSQWGSPGAAGQVPAGRALTAAFFNNSGQSLPVGPGGSPRAKAGPSSGTSFSFYSGKNMAKMKATEKPARLQWFLDLNRFILCVFFSFFSFVAKGKRTQRIQQHNETCNELESPAPSRSRR